MKKIIVLYDSKGKIISAGHMEPASAGPKGAPAPRFGVKARTGQKVAELEVPTKHEKLALNELIEKLEVDVKGKEPSLRQRKAR